MPRKKLVVKRTKTGLGLFTTEPIPKGKRIVEYTGTIITDEEAEKRGGKYLYNLPENLTLDGSARTNLARYINHSCRPNAVAYLSGNRVWIWSKRGIKAGEEITTDYGREYFEEFIKPKGCQCEKCSAY